MKVDVRKEAPSRAVLEVELPPDVVSQGKERALARLNQRVEIPGFRRGKAPKTLLERHVGTGTVHEEAVNLLVPDAYTQAVRQSGVRPIAQPEIRVDPLEDGKPLRFVATVDLVPDVKLGDYKALRITPTEPTVTDADVDAAIEDLRARHARLESVGERPATKGDYVLLRIVQLDGTAERLVMGKDYLVEVGSGDFPAELESALLGKVRGQQDSVTLAGGATIEFDVTDVKSRILPELTDEFAKTGGGADSVEGLRGAQRARLQGEAQVTARQAEEQDVVDALLQGASIELPASLVDHEVLHLVADLAESLGRRGITLQRYLQVQEKTDAQLREELRPTAERRLRTQLALDEVARAEGLQPSQEEIDREAENVARGSQQDLAQVREWLAQDGRLDSLTAALRRRKALAALVAIARGDPR
jgi:trigger factor